MNEFQKVYLKTLRKDFNLDFGYLISYRPVNKKESYLSINTMWIGSKGLLEIRQPGLVNTVSINAHFNLLRYPLLTVSNTTQLFSFLVIGGHAIISKDIIAMHWKNLLNPRIVIEIADKTYLDYESIEEKHKKRFAKGNLRMEIFKRDKYQCRICGASPEDNVHISLETHHIKPWEEGGISSPDNLITLCATCHEGAKSIDREILYRKIGLKFPKIEHELFLSNDKWSYEQIRSYNYLLSNTVSFKLNNSPLNRKI